MKNVLNCIKTAKANFRGKCTALNASTRKMEMSENQKSKHLLLETENQRADYI